MARHWEARRRGRGRAPLSRGTSQCLVWLTLLQMTAVAAAASTTMGSVSFHAVEIGLVKAMSDADAKLAAAELDVSSKSAVCSASLTVMYVEESTPRMRPKDLGVVSNVGHRWCGRSAPNDSDSSAWGLRLWPHAQLCDELSDSDFCGAALSCDDLRARLRPHLPALRGGDADDVPLYELYARLQPADSSNSSATASDAQLAAFLMEDLPVGALTGFLRALALPQADNGTAEAPENDGPPSARTLLSGDVLLTTVLTGGESGGDGSAVHCAFVAENRRNDDGFVLSHRFEVQRSAHDKMASVEAKLARLWAAKLGVWPDTVHVELFTDERTRRLLMEMRVSSLSERRVKTLARAVVLEDVLQCLRLAEESVVGSVVKDGGLWYRIDGGGVLSVLLGGWKRVGSVDWSLLVALTASFVAVVGVLLVYRKVKRSGGLSGVASRLRYRRLSEHRPQEMHELNNAFIDDDSE